MEAAKMTEGSIATAPLKEPLKEAKKKTRILLVEDDQILREVITEYYTPRGYEVLAYEDPQKALIEQSSELAPEGSIEVVLTDLRLPSFDGLEFIQRIRRGNPMIPIVLMTAHSSVQTAIQAIEKGAYDFVVKPPHFEQLSLSLERALHFYRLNQENMSLKQAQGVRTGEWCIGRSAKIQSVFELARRVASSPATVVIQGESGTGKEVIARMLHSSGARKSKRFVAINCSAIPETLLESELFGYAKGAFTGAQDKRVGLFEEAEGGTLFLDEIGDLSLSLQAKFLRVLQERRIRRLGENVSRPIDVRIVAATHLDLRQAVKAGRFREDLYFRLNVIPIQIPPLRERKEDILPLAEHFLRVFRVQNSSPAKAFTVAAKQKLLDLPWRGNVRELENTIERCAVLAEGDLIDAKDIYVPTEEAGAANVIDVIQGATENPPATPEATTAPAEDTSRYLEEYQAEQAAEKIAEESAAAMRSHLIPREKWFVIGEHEDLPRLEDIQGEYVQLVMRRVNGVREKATRILGVDRKTLYRWLKDKERQQQQSQSHVSH